jgi:hypothetical protein
VQHDPRDLAPIGPFRIRIEQAHVGDYAHPVIMRSSQEQGPISIGFSDDFLLANCA